MTRRKAMEKISDPPAYYQGTGMEVIEAFDLGFNL